MDLDLNWMAWTWQTAVFFLTILTFLISMTIWCVVSPQVPRKGILRFETTRGDRLFISFSAALLFVWGGLVSSAAPSGERWEYVSSMPDQCFAGFDEKVQTVND